MADKGQGEKHFETEEDLTQIEIPSTLPLLPLRGIVIFPNQTHPFLVSRPSSLKLLEDVAGRSQLIAFAAQKNPEEENPSPEALYQCGTAVRILKMLKYPDKSVRVLVQGIARIELQQITQREPYFVARVRRLTEKLNTDREVDALQANLVTQFSKFVSLVPYLPDELQVMAMQVREASRLTDLVASYLKIAVEELQDLLATLDVRQRLEKLLVILTREIELLELGHKIQSQVQSELNKSQREYYLRQQLKAIQRELGEGDGRSSEIDELAKKIEAAKMPEEARKAADKELDRLKMIPPESAEHTVVRTYIDWLVTLPWSVSTEDNLDIKHARAVLDEDHYDLEKVKERILEFLAVRKLKQDTKGPILCFVGPPGTGKTSLGRSIARALGRKFVRLSLGAIGEPTSARCLAGLSRASATPGRRTRCSSSMRSTNSARISAATPHQRCSKYSIRSRTTRSRIIISMCRSISRACCSSPLRMCSTPSRPHSAIGWKCWNCRVTPRKRSCRSSNVTWCRSNLRKTASKQLRSSFLPMRWLR